MKQKLEGGGSSKAAGEQTTPENPFTRKNRDLNGTRTPNSAKGGKIFERKDPQQSKMELIRTMKWVQVRTVPFLKSLLCFDFFGRLIFFVGVSYWVMLQVHELSQERVSLKQEDSSSPNRYSKTFGREETLDKLLAQADDQSPKEGRSSAESPIGEKSGRLEEQPEHTKKL